MKYAPIATVFLCQAAFSYFMYIWLTFTVVEVKDMIWLNMQQTKSEIGAFQHVEERETGVLDITPSSPEQCVQNWFVNCGVTMIHSSMLTRKMWTMLTHTLTMWVSHWGHFANTRGCVVLVGGGVDARGVSYSNGAFGEAEANGFTFYYLHWSVYQWCAHVGVGAESQRAESVSISQARAQSSHHLFLIHGQRLC
jgi:hypothetical protein